MFVVLDLETTGLSPKDDAIIEIACVKIERKTFQEVGRFHTFINPGKSIPDLIRSITHISDGDVKSAPVFGDIRDEVQDFLGGCPIIGHNISFDLKFLEAAGIDTSKNPPIDTFFLANFLCFNVKSLNLGYLCEAFGISLSQAHRALDDTLATLSLFSKLISLLQELPQEQQDIVYYYLSHTQDMGLRVLRDTYLDGAKILKEKTDICNYYIIQLEKNIVDIHDIFYTQEATNINNLLSQIPGFELRENQKMMLDKVDKAFSHGEKVVIEAATGIGKTFAYLLPAISYSLKTGESVHISTSTKALQDQIYLKDLSLIQTYFPNKFSYTKLKGKRNYLCISSFLEYLDTSTPFSSSSLSFLFKIFFWSLQTEFGELDDLDYYGEEFYFLSEINAASYNIFNESNPYKHLEFALRARLRAKSSNIVICNNHILFQDIISEGSLLGGVKNLVLDEAHTLEDVVTQSLKKSVSFLQLQQLFLKIDTKFLKYKLNASSCMYLRQQILYDVSELLGLLEGSIFEVFRSDVKYKTLLLDQIYFSTRPNLSLLATKISHALGEYQIVFSEQFETSLGVFTAELQELNSIKQLFIEAFIFNNTQKNIHYISYEDQKGLQFHITVLNPGDFLREHLWSNLECVILTSATLQMEGNFSYIQNLLQISDFETCIYYSDFDYSKQALVYIPQDIGSIKNNIPQVIAFLKAFFLVVQGKTLVLFTAFTMIREVFTQLKLPLEISHIELLAQSIGGSKLKQIEAFKKNPDTSILLGTDSFWEGIDIPGEDLQYLVIHKIPFQVPTDPIFIARSALYEDSFGQYAIPKSILKLKQGFGRLIRTKKDTGVVVFLDDRIFSTHWGKKYLESFPIDVRILYGSTQKLLEILQKKD